VRSLEELGRVRLSTSFFMRDFLYSEIADFCGIPNIPDAPEVAIAAGRKLCELLLEPLQATFGRLAIRSAYRAPAVNEFGNRRPAQPFCVSRSLGHRGQLHSLAGQRGDEEFRRPDHALAMGPAACLRDERP
jgi:hypothetical protein